MGSGARLSCLRDGPVRDEIAMGGLAQRATGRREARSRGAANRSDRDGPSCI